MLLTVVSLHVSVAIAGSVVLNLTILMAMTRDMASRGIGSETAIAHRRQTFPGTEPLGACAIGLERSCGSRSVSCLSVQQPRACR